MNASRPGAGPRPDPDPHARTDPPRLATALLDLVVPEGLARDSVVGDLAEELERRAAHGRLRASLWYWRMALQVSTSYMGEALRRAPGRRWQDLRFAARSFRRSPAFAAFAAATLAVGIAATTSVFSVADTLLLRPLRLFEPDRLVRVHANEPGRGEWYNVVSGATYLDWVDRARSFQGLAAYRAISYNLLGGDFPERVAGVSVTEDFFDVLGVEAALGRTALDEEAAGGARTVLLAHALWRSRFGSDPNVLGRSLTLNGEPHTVLGVTPPELTFPGDVDVYVPSTFRVPASPTSSADMSSDRGAEYLSVIGRLAPGVGVESAQAEMDAISADIARAFPETSAGEGASVVSLRQDMVGDTRATLIMLLGAAGFVMLIACANVANLLTVRASRRSRELTIRMGLGAGIGRLRSQLLTESVLLSVLGGLPGLLLAVWGTRALVALAPEGVPRLDEITVDVRVFAFTALLTLIAGLLFGLAPTVGLSRPRYGLLPRGPGGAVEEARRSRLRDTVVVGEVALSLLLLIGAGLMVRTLQGLHDTDPGFDPESTLVAHVSLPLTGYETDAAVTGFYAEALARIGELPGVESAATVLTLPMRWAMRGTFGFFIEGRESDDSDPMLAGYQVVSPGYFETLRIDVLRGRTIESVDTEETTTVAVINEALARRHWPGTDPVGDRLTFWGRPDDPDTEWATIVGVVESTALEGLDRPPVPEVYLALRQVPMNRSTFVVRSAGDPTVLAPALREAIGRVDPAVPLYGVSSLEAVLAESLATRRFRMLLLAAFATAALVMASVGLYGVLAFSVAQRGREIGIRRALGAPSDEVVLQVVGEGFARVILGLAAGMVASVMLSRFIASQIFGVSATDPVTYAASAFLLAAVSLLSCWVPAARAARIDPVAAIRSE